MGWDELVYDLFERLYPSLIINVERLCTHYKLKKKNVCEVLQYFPSELIYVQGASKLTRP